MRPSALASVTMPAQTQPPGSLQPPSLRTMAPESMAAATRAATVANQAGNAGSSWFGRGGSARGSAVRPREAATAGRLLVPALAWTCHQERQSSPVSMAGAKALPMSR